MNYKVSVVLERDPNGYFAYVPELPGCVSQGDSAEEAVENIREAAELYLEDLPAEERAGYLSREISTQTLDLSIA